MSDSILSRIVEVNEHNLQYNSDIRSSPVRSNIFQSGPILYHIIAKHCLILVLIQDILEYRPLLTFEKKKKQKRFDIIIYS